MSARAHFWTLWPRFRRALVERPVVGGVSWSTTVEDPDVGTVTLEGILHRPRGSRHCVVLVHGLGGRPESVYNLAAERVAASHGLATLRFGFRGTEGRGEDIYHAGLSSDLLAVLESEALREFEALTLLGFSLGGHVALKAATEVDDGRLRAVAAICSPLDLRRAVDRFDLPTRWIYRMYVLRNLRKTWTDVALRRGGLDASPADIARVSKIRRWDELTVVPRFGFRDPDHYYSTQSVGPRVGELRVPALLVGAIGDPMVDRVAIDPWADPVGGSRLEVRWTDRGGHVGFPADLDLGLGAAVGLESQVFSWLDAVASSPGTASSASQATSSPTRISPSSSATP